VGFLAVDVPGSGLGFEGRAAGNLSGGAPVMNGFGNNCRTKGSMAATVQFWGSHAGGPEKQNEKEILLIQDITHNF
jgi:hypothetical protein